MKSTVSKTMVFDDVNIDALVEEAMKPMRTMSDAEYNAYWAEREKMKALIPLYETVSALDFDCEITKTLCKRCREEHDLEDIDVECVIYELNKIIKQCTAQNYDPNFDIQHMIYELKKLIKEHISN